MDMNDYQNAAMRTFNPEQTQDERLSNFALGLAGEAGEAVEMVKKAVFHGHPLDRDRMAKELGDVLWYVSGLATACGLSLADIAEGNIAKLRKRFPEGFSAAASLARVDVAEGGKGVAE